MGLDWDQPSYQTPAANPLPSSRLEIDLGFWSLNLKAESLYREKKYTEAIEAWQKSLTALPNQPGVHYQIGLAYFLQARHAEALPHFSRVIVLEPGHAEARHRRSHCYAVDGNLKDALADVTEAIRLRPGEAAYCTLRASLLSRLGRLPEAVADWDRSLALRPDQFLLLAQVAELHLFGPPEIRNFSLVLGRAGQALNLAENRTSPANEGWISRALTLKGAACCRLGKHQESREALQRVGKKGSGTSTALTYYFLAIASFHLGDKDGASRSFQQARDWHGRQFRLTAEFEARCKALDAEVRMLLSVKHPE
jgi:tetratricopeptide (TPR) repeat protein